MTTLSILVLILAAAAPAAAWYLWERGRRYTEAMSGGLHEDISLPHESEFELYHNALSLCSKKTRVCLDELTIPYTAHHIDLIETGGYENIRHDFLEVNPGGILPVLVHNGHPIYESDDQLRYAADHAPPGCPRLVPDNPDAEQKMQHWIDCASIIGDNPLDAADRSAGSAIPALTLPLFASMIDDIGYMKILEGLLFHRLRQRPMIFLVLKAVGLKRLHKIGPAMKVVRKCVRHMHTHLDALEVQLASHGDRWILGEQFTLADVSWVVIFERLRECDYEHVYLGDGKRPYVTDYWQRLRDRPSYTRAIVEYGHPTITRGLMRLREAKRSLPALRQALEGN
jgi:glutathione S-transferase